MNRLHLLLTFFLISAAGLYAQNSQVTDKHKDSVVSIYSIETDSIGGKTKIDFSHFKGKKIMIVNAAILDTNFSQLFELRKLKEMLGSDFVIVLVPCSDFNPDAATEKQIANFLSGFGLPFYVTAKEIVTGKRKSPLYEWLTSKKLNGVNDSEVRGAFQKYLINEKGVLEGSFLPTQRPITDQSLKMAVTKKQNG